MNTLKRRRLLEMVGGSLLLAGCGGGNGALQSMPGARTRDARAQVTKSARHGVAFPARRPDGSLPPATDRNYVPAKRLDASSGRTTRFQRICNPDQECSPPSGGGGGGGASPDDVLSIDDATAYGWEASNYTELWDSLGSSLDAQIYYSLNGTVLSGRMVGSDGTEATVSIDMASITTQGTTYLSDGSRITIGDGGTTYSVVTAGGTTISGTTTQSGYQTLTVTRSVGGQRLAGPVTGNKQLPWPPGRPPTVNCLQTLAQAAAMLAVVTALALEMVKAECTLGASPQCAAAIALANLIIGEAQELYKQIVHNACA